MMLFQFLCQFIVQFIHLRYVGKVSFLLKVKYLERYVELNLSIE